jgi:hypothetical protein
LVPSETIVATTLPLLAWTTVIEFVQRVRHPDVFAVECRLFGTSANGYRGSDRAIGSNRHLHPVPSADPVAAKGLPEAERVKLEAQHALILQRCRIGASIAACAPETKPLPATPDGNKKVTAAKSAACYSLTT